MMSATSLAQEKPLAEAAIPPQEVEVNGKEGNIHPVSFVQQISKNPRTLHARVCIVNIVSIESSKLPAKTGLRQSVQGSIGTWSRYPGD